MTQNLGANSNYYCNFATELLSTIPSQQSQKTETQTLSGELEQSATVAPRSLKFKT